MSRGALHLVRARGLLAHFSGVSFGPERHTMLVPSHSACVGILRSVIDKWAVRFAVESVSLLSVPQITPIKSNELKSFDCKVGARTGTAEPIDSDTQRTQRTRTFLVEPDYLIRARIELSPRFADTDDSVQKFDAMFTRRLAHGQFRYGPYLGIRECIAELTPVDDEASLPPVADVSEDYGIAFFDKDMDADGEPAYLAPLRVERGVVRYPSFAEVRRLGLRYELERAA